MQQTKKIQSALVSVFNKEGLEPIVKTLHNQGVTFYSTGGTQAFLEELNVPVIAVENVTSYPSILGGRVKTLHPKIFGGILNRRDNESDVQQIEEFEIPEIDLVIVDLYPFEETLAKGGTHDEIIEKIDIGGISLIRAAAKNYQDVVIISAKEYYSDFLTIISNQNGETTLEQRREFAREAFHISSHYDTKIFDYFNQGEKPYLKVSESKSSVLRYGENPHQRGFFHGDLNAIFDKLNGKELSYNNLLDVDAAVNLIYDFSADEPTFAILKHNNACGLASRKTICEAYNDALAGDPVSAFGGVLISNTEIDIETAHAMNDLFFEVLIAPSYSKDVLEILSTKKNRIILKQKPFSWPKTVLRSALNGVLEEDRNDRSENAIDLTPQTENKPTTSEVDDLLFANKIVKHTKSNTIVLAKNKQLLGSGTGQTSRVDALKQAIAKANSFAFDLKGSVMASDAFFPFPDCVEIAHNEGITAVIQPGGSIKDQLSIDYCNSVGLKMVFTGTRHFKH
jgi:phosphoribosylaminoimidazolecarboxamide formyltransferase/IMP cyclohydrolase